MKIDDIAKQLANKVNQEHYIKHYLEKVQRGAYNKGLKDAQTEKLILNVVVPTLKDCLIAKQPVEYKNKKYYLTTLRVMNSGEEICELMNTDTYEVISDVNGEEVKIF